MPLGIETWVRGVHRATVRGLLHGKTIQHGYKCVDKGLRPRTKRDWKPNVQYKFLYSEVLARRLRLLVTTDVLKRIDRAGGLDMYLLTDSVGSRSSLVGAELRKVIRQAYKDAELPLPKKTGPTSILAIVHERLQAQNGAPASQHSHALRGEASTLSQAKQDGAGSRPVAEVAAAPAESAATAIPAASLPAAEGVGSSPSTSSDTAKSDPEASLSAAAPSGSGDTAAEDSMVYVDIDDGQVAGAQQHSGAGFKRREQGQVQRKVLAQRLPGVHSWARIAPVPYRGAHTRGWLASRPVRRGGGPLKTGRRVPQQVEEALLRAKRAQARSVSRRNGLVRTMRGQAYNELLRRRAADPLQPFVTPYVWLQDFVEGLQNEEQRKQWQYLWERFRPTVPGMIIDNTFVPASNRFGGYSPGAPPQLTAQQQGTDAAGSTAIVGTEVAPSKPAGVPREYSALHKEPSRWRLLRSGSVTTAHGSLQLRTAHKIGCQMQYQQRVKYQKMAKWLDDKWLQAHIVPKTDNTKLVLPNQMVLWSVRRRRGKGKGPLSWKRSYDGVPNPAVGQRARLRGRHMQQGPAPPGTQPSLGVDATVGTAGGSNSAMTE